MRGSKEWNESHVRNETTVHLTSNREAKFDGRMQAKTTRNETQGGYGEYRYSYMAGTEGK